MRADTSAAPPAPQRAPSEARGARVSVRGSWRRTLARLLWVGIALLGLLSVAAFVQWRREIAEIREIVGPHIDADAAPLEIMVQARDFMRDHVGYKRAPGYFLLPVFEFMRPTALQVLRGGGDCAYRSRAYIVILNTFGVEASKRALYDDQGNSVHAVAEVDIEGEPKRYVDLLFNLIHEGADGRPLTLAQLENDSILAASIDRAIAAGNERAERYPIDEYGFGDVRTINWNKSGATVAAYRILAAAFGSDRVSNMKRPYLAEEPALMVIVLCMGGAGMLLLMILLIRPRAGSIRTAQGADA